MSEPASGIWKIPLFNLCFDEQEREAVNRVMDRGWLTMGPENQQFEEQFAQFHKSKHCLTAANCTAALHMAVASVGIMPGDEVIVPSLTFVATANAVRYAGATPVFADCISANRPILDPQSVEKCITPKTRAIIVVHYAGYPCDMDEFCRIACANNLKLIEDCAHCPGGMWNGKYLGTWGDVGCFSFFSNKNMSMGEGGAILVQSDELAEKLKLMRSHGMTTLTLDRHKGHAFSYDVTALGYNYRLDEMRAAIGLAQLEKLPEMNLKRRAIVEFYRKLLSQLPVEIPFLHYEKASGVDHIMPIFLKNEVDRTSLMTRMREMGIQTSIHYPCIHQFSDFKNSVHGALPVTEDLSKRELTLPLYPSMTEADVEQVVSALAGGLHV